MPELPEVETIKKGLQKYIVGHTIEKIDARLPKMVSGNSNAIIGAKIASVERFGKGLVIGLSNDYSVAIHIKMTGQLIYRGPNAPKTLNPATEKIGKTLPNNATHVIFYLDKDGLLYYNDIRQFGWIKIVKSGEVKNLPFFKELGPEPFKDLDEKIFTEILKKKKSPVKVVLMDQKVIGGIGNIYANDSLSLAKIHPTRPANSLSNEEMQKLFISIEAVLKKGLEVGGASEWQYVNALGEAGKYQNFFEVYGKKGKLCRVCGTKIEKMTLSSRGTFFCPHCQK